MVFLRLSTLLRAQALKWQTSVHACMCVYWLLVPVFLLQASVFWSISYYSSPFAFFYLYRKGQCVFKGDGEGNGCIVDKQAITLKRKGTCENGLTSLFHQASSSSKGGAVQKRGFGLQVGAKLGRRAERHCGEFLILSLSPARLLEFVQGGAIFSLCWNIAATTGRCGLPPR
jgi:hypothetical protein